MLWLQMSPISPSLEPSSPVVPPDGVGAGVTGDGKAAYEGGKRTDNEITLPIFDATVSTFTVYADFCIS